MLCSRAIDTPGALIESAVACISLLTFLMIRYVVHMGFIFCLVSVNVTFLCVLMCV